PIPVTFSIVAKVLRPAMWKEVSETRTSATRRLLSEAPGSDQIHPFGSESVIRLPGTLFTSRAALASAGESREHASVSVRAAVGTCASASTNRVADIETRN